MRIRPFTVLVAVGALLTLPPAPSSGAEAHEAGPQPVRAEVTTVAFTFVPPAISVGQGGGLDLVNRDVAPHNLTSVDAGPDGEPLFASQTIGGGLTAPVDGVEELDAGTYQFWCTLHPWMQGALDVNTAGVQVPPPVPTPPVPEPTETVAAPAGVVTTPTSLTTFDGAMYVASYAQGTVFRLPILEGGVLGPASPYVTGVSNPLGLAFAPDGTLFVADSHPSARSDRTTAGRVWAFPRADGAAGEGTVLIDELPNGRHNTNGMAVRDGRLFVTNGNSTDDGVSGGEPEETLSGTLVSVPLSAVGGPTIVVPADGVPDGLTVEATGMRNDYDVAFRPGTDEAWLTVNGPDPFPDRGEDTLVKATVGDGVVDGFGFPHCVYDASATARDNPNVEGDCADHPHDPPEQVLGLHVSANGLAFGPDDGGFWDGDLFIAEFGNFFGDEVVGHRVVRVPIGPHGEAGPPQDFVLGPAPLDLTFGEAGLYVADFATGQITLYRTA